MAFEMMPWTGQWVSPDLTSNHHYSAAPINEAVIEVRVSGSEAQIELDDLRVLGLGLTGWGDANVAEMFSGNVVIGDDGEASATSEVSGFQMLRADGQRTIHILPDRIAYAWTAPYDKWESFQAEFWDIWRPFVAAVQPAEITRISARFVNVIRIPKAQVEIRDYLRTTVDLSPVLPQSVRSLFMQVDVPLVPGGDLGVNITSAIAVPAQPDETALVLDLDTYDQRAITVGSDTEAEVTARLGTLRTAKNFVFEASITDATRGLIS